MKIFRLYVLYLFIFYAGIISLSGQCGDIVLRSQNDINGFIKKYGKCKTINNLTIFDSANDIVQFDSLYHVERIEGRFEIQANRDQIKKLDGLHNLKFVNYLRISAVKLSNTFASLDTVNHLIIRSDSTVYRALNSVRYIRKSLTFAPIDYCLSNHLANFTTGTAFTLIVSFNSNISTNCLHRLSKNIETKNLRRLKFGTENHVLSHFNIIDSIETLYIWSAKSDFTAIEKLTNLRNIKIEWDSGDNNYGEGFKRTYHLDSLLLENNKKIKSYYSLFPSLQTIRHHLYIIGNDALINLDFLKDVTLPKTSQDTISIIIQDNKMLNDCNVNLLCEALVKYPNSVIIKNNGSKCTKEEILKYCETVETKVVDKPILVISPNPTFGYLKIEHIEQPISIRISNMSGQDVKIMSNIQNEINIEDLPPGMYIFDIRNKEISERHKIVKVE